jgi:hypothetical protein
MESKRTVAHTYIGIFQPYRIFDGFSDQNNKFCLDFQIKKQGRQDLLNSVNQVLKKLLEIGFTHNFRGGE